MTFREMMAAIRYALGSVLRFSGRDGRGLFWPWAIFVFLLMQAASMLIMIPVMFSGFMRVLQTIQKQDFESGAGPDPAVVERAMAQMVTGFGWLWIPTALIDAIIVALLAAAVMRRLHDRDRTAFWGLLPLPFKAIGVAFMPATFAFALAPTQPNPAMKLLLLQAPFFWGSLLWLCFLLAGEGTKGPNRFGQATREAP
ncbi:MAG TPA: DUF805 domain-containing protein [Allosphingosinicella sp.]|nr:DUF805 domain-containing protein [Allosphingosinicella sp.]